MTKMYNLKEKQR